MKRTAKEFRKYVSDIRRMRPAFNHGRKVVVLGEGTRKADEIITLGCRYEGYWLNQIYDRWSQAKQEAYDLAWDMYRNSRHGNTFGICSHNSFGFTVSWLSDDGLTVLTRDTEYLVIFNE